MAELPIELWIRILDELPKEDRTRLYPVNQTFMHILFAKKYRRVRVGDFLARHKEKRVLKYIAHISQPHITQHIRHVTIVLAPDAVIAHRPTTSEKSVSQIVARAAKYPGWGGIGYPVKKISQAVANFLSLAAKVDSISIGGWQNAADEPLSGFVSFIWDKLAPRLRELELVGYHTAISDVLSSPFPSFPCLETLSLNFHATSFNASATDSSRKKTLSKPVTAFLNHTFPTIRRLSLVSTTGSSFSPNIVLPKVAVAPNITSLDLNIIGGQDDPVDFAVFEDFVARNSAKLEYLQFPPQEWQKPVTESEAEVSVADTASPVKLASLGVLSTYSDVPASTSVQSVQAFAIPSKCTLTSLTLADGYLYLSEIKQLFKAFDPTCNPLRHFDARTATVTPSHFEYLTTSFPNLSTLHLRTIAILHDVELERQCVGRDEHGLVPETAITTPKLFLNRLRTYPHAKLCSLKIDRPMHRGPLPNNFSITLRAAIPSLKELIIS